MHDEDSRSMGEGFGRSRTGLPGMLGYLRLDGVASLSSRIRFPLGVL